MMNRIKKFSESINKRTARFAKDTSGSLALMIGITAVPVIMIAGAAVDFYRISAAKAEIQSSLDAGALAGAAAKAGTSNAKRRELAMNTFDANLTGGLSEKLQGSANVEIDGESLTMSYSGDLPTTLLKVGGFDEFTIGVKSTVNLRKPPRAEISMVLDYSGSMGQTSAGRTKYVTMRNAAIDMINGLSDNGTNRDIRFGLVPFAHAVYATLPSGFVVGANGGNWTGCTYDRRFPFNTTAGAPNGSDNSKWGQPRPRSGAVDECSATSGGGSLAARNMKVRPLTSNHGDTIAQLRRMTPGGYTNISLATNFGWHLLEPGAPFAARSHDDEKNKKFLVVLTDGRQTTPVFGPGGSRTVANGEQNLSTICNNVKRDEKITVVTIAFDLRDNATENRLRNCATDPDQHFFKAENSNDLTAAFEEIQNQIASAIFLSE